ncbi:wax ester/triacylglycerol synthase family O-acyltransferase [Lentzea sp. BCCO 10_0061]|uniref:diacylglycerol O-acyltransferase n=1 Tax=Lentzea sokolovensis TaxID=3095429 RepID=A0ABU4UPP7_9PSEU|nr:wax ester/triacylglycerol synthase domain-containing protein [Lentzea sp. BCCO 10_0061]MDX8141463.1 wax ester/triacylglycerol synthase family O-acyltransferase [Lentzea sp. BCCO 10_0061]
MIDRTSSDDLVSLASGMQVGAVVVLERDPGGVEAVLADRVRTVPRLRRRLVRAPFGCGRPVWVDDAGFDISRHVHRVVCPAPGDDAALLGIASSLVTRPLPQSSPLWSATLVIGLAEDKAALVLVFHHVLSDGIGGLAVLANLVDGAPQAEIVPFPAPAPSRRELAKDAWTTRLRLPGRNSFAGLGWPSLGSRCSLNHPTGSRRRQTMTRTSVSRLHAAAHRCGGTVNDALLTVVTGALGTVLNGRGDHLDELVVSIPVSTRRSTTATHLGNSTGVMPVALPTGGDPCSRLTRIAAITRSHKRSVTSVAPIFRTLKVLGMADWFMNHQRMVHTVVTNVHGPDHPMRLGGAQVVALIPLSATTGNVTVAFAALSYADAFTIMVVADPDRVPDLLVLTEALQNELDLLA